MSGYLDKVVGGEYYRRKGWTYISFSEFIGIVLAQGRERQDFKMEKVDLHWRPINAECYPCSINYTVISQMDTYNEDKMRFLKMVGMKEEFMENHAFHVHAGESIQEKTKSLFQEISKKDHEELKKMYKYDLELFGYDPDIY